MVRRHAELTPGTTTMTLPEPAMKRTISALTILLLAAACPLAAQSTLQRYDPVNFSQVKVTDDFWNPKMKRVATTTLAACIYQTEVKTPRIRNFEKVARRKGEKHEGIYYDDSDVYKALEAMAYSIATQKDSSLEATADRWIDAIAAAQMPDGYLFTYYELGDIDRRWTEIGKHEDYCAGHLIEAGIAYFNATGKRRLLDVAIRFADHIDSTFRLQNRKWFSGHQEIELALMKLYRLTGNDRYLKLADWYLAQRGRGYYAYDGGWLTADYWQDALPVKDQKEITGHAVRAMYLYSGAADVAAVTGDTGYVRAMKTVWNDVVQRNMYVTGGIGATGDNEGFGTDYELPNDLAYCETCASVGMVFWNHRMNQMTGDARYMDVLERSLYNGALDGVSLKGDRFFYDNVLASDGKNERREWFGTACCPSNISRLVASVGNYIYGVSGDGIWVNLFVGSETEVEAGGTKVALKMKTGYPWDGKVRIMVEPERDARFTLRLRIPSWTGNAIDQADIYRFAGGAGTGEISLSVNGVRTGGDAERGYLLIDRSWTKGDVVEYDMPMEVRKVLARDEVTADRDRAAIQRGPLVYCVEGTDNGGSAWNIVLPEDATFSTTPYDVAGERVVAIRAEMDAVGPTGDGTGVRVGRKTVTAIPYYCWANRGGAEMQVWLPEKIHSVKIDR